MTNLASSLTTTAANAPGSTAIAIGGNHLPYAALFGAAAKLAGELTAAGIEPGDRVALILPNVPAYPVAFFGTLLAGGTVVPMNPLLKSGEIDFFFTDSGAKIAFVWPDFVDEATKGAKNSGTRIITCDPMGPVAGQLDGGEPVTTPVERADDDTAVILYTSGTTGRPKGAELTHANLRLNAKRCADDIIQVTADDVLMGCLPLFHVFGLTVGLLAGGPGRGDAGAHPALRPSRRDRDDRGREGHRHARRPHDVCRDPPPPGQRQARRLAPAHVRLRRLGDAGRGAAGVRREVRLRHPRGLRAVRDLAGRLLQYARPAAQVRAPSGSRSKAAR
jgi:hypothetical protein